MAAPLLIAARVVRAIGVAAAVILVIGILLYVFEANTGNALVGVMMDVARWFAEPFRGIFQVEENKAQIVFNWGIGACVYAVAGYLLAILLERTAARQGKRDDSSTAETTSNKTAEAS